MTQVLKGHIVHAPALGRVDITENGFLVLAVDTEALFGVGISGSGTGAETILLTKRKREFYVNVR